MGEKDSIPHRQDGQNGGKIGKPNSGLGRHGGIFLIGDSMISIKLAKHKRKSVAVARRGTKPPPARLSPRLYTRTRRGLIAITENRRDRSPIGARARGWRLRRPANEDQCRGTG